MSVDLPDEEVLGVIELLGFVTGLCNNERDIVTEALSRFTGVCYPATELRDDVIASADYLAKALGFMDATMETVRVLLTAEVAGRDRSTIENKRRRAHFPAGKSFDTWIESRSSIPTATQRALKSLEWVTRSENLVVAGPHGTP